MAKHKCLLHGERPEMAHEDAICNLCVEEAMEIDTRNPNWWKRPEDGGPNRTPLIGEPRG